jgi:3-hydroxyisobutyrate dehydrogenase-like beta-hydroxyacid dehydrogenase
MKMQNGKTKVGFIGLGHMGAAMPGPLLDAGHDDTVYNRTPNKAITWLKELNMTRMMIR